MMLLVQSVCMMAQKSVYIPWEWRNFNAADTLLYAESDPDNKYTWSKSRSKESDNFIVFWEKGYGNTIPTNAASAYRVDIDDLLAKSEVFYKLNVERLGFADLAVSKLKKYKIIIVLNYSTGWICYGGGYDFEAAALWLGPSSCQPVGQSVAHEIGHSFQYMCYSDYGQETGFHSSIGKGASIWEQTAQWQSVMSYPELMFGQSISVFKNAHNYAFSHEWQRYQSYWYHYYLAEKYGDDVVGRIWRHEVDTPMDFNQVYMDMVGYTAEQLYREYMDYAMKMVTWDLDACREYGKNYIGNFTYNYVPLGGTKHQVAYSSCPQATGFNVIPLNVPEAGTTVSTRFTSLTHGGKLAEGDPALFLNGESAYAESGLTKYNYLSETNARAFKRGFRLGYVALLEDGTRVYSCADSIYCYGKAKAEVSVDVPFTVPENVDRMWLVVSPALSEYMVHKWDDDYTNDDQWPYQVEFTGTNIYGAPNIQEGMVPTDLDLTYDIYMPVLSNYGGMTVKLEGNAVAALGTALQMQASDIASKMVAYSASGSQPGQVMFYGLRANGRLYAGGSTANGYGHWFNASGNVTTYSASPCVFSEFNASGLSFFIGQQSGACSVGDTYTIGQALRYKDADGNTSLVRFFFNIHIASGKASYELTSIDLEEQPNAIEGVSMGNPDAPVNVYSVDGRMVKSGVKAAEALDGLDRGIYIFGGKKHLVK